MNYYELATHTLALRQAIAENVVRDLRERRPALVLGDTGTGKTYLAATAASMLVPSHLVVYPCMGVGHVAASNWAYLFEQFPPLQGQDKNFPYFVGKPALGQNFGDRPMFLFDEVFADAECHMTYQDLRNRYPTGYFLLCGSVCPAYSKNMEFRSMASYNL